MPKENKTEKIVRELVLPLIEPEGFELVDVEYQKEGRNWVLRLFIDQEKGIDLDDCQHVSNIVSDALDEKDPIPHQYLLEVSSPGIERPLKTKNDFLRFCGRKASIKLFLPLNGEKEFTGELGGVEDNSVVIKTGDGEKRVEIDHIAKAHLAYDF
ncbi:MAG: ribosome maturation factor RimP [Desulfitobacteriaceae bacterium]|nr:ribosome maturation factor RimP [Desulfitobacteriaceae bacterium]MDD4751769.1 ribosome maturation factor RimP [Desulfitobacteriaceae bacterium]